MEELRGAYGEFDGILVREGVHRGVGIHRVAREERTNRGQEVEAVGFDGRSEIVDVLAARVVVRVEPEDAVREEKGDLVLALGENVVDGVIGQSVVREKRRFHSGKVERSRRGVVEREIHRGRSGKEQHAGGSVVVRRIVAYGVGHGIRTETGQHFGEGRDVGFFVVSDVAGFLGLSRFVFAHEEKLEELAGVVFVGIALVGLVEEVEEFALGVISGSAVAEKHAFHHRLVVAERIRVEEVALVLDVLVGNGRSVGVDGENIFEKEGEFRLGLVRVAGEFVLVVFVHAAGVPPIEAAAGEVGHFGVEGRTVGTDVARKNHGHGVRRGTCGIERIDHGRSRGEKGFPGEVLGLGPRPIGGSPVGGDGVCRNDLHAGKDDGERDGDGAADEVSHGGFQVTEIRKIRHS